LRDPIHNGLSRLEVLLARADSIISFHYNVVASLERAVQGSP
jgi:hypothetical protein